VTLAHVIPSQGRERVSALASLGDEVFVLRQPSQQQIDVYDAATFALHHEIAVPGLGKCPSNRCLYASDLHNDSVHRVKLSGSNAVEKWKVARRPFGLSVNKAHNVVVACYDANTLQEYTTHGSLVREIPVQAAGQNSWHAVQLSSNGDYAVCHFTSPGVVSVVGVNGQVVSSYRQTSDGRQMKCPRGLAVTKNDDILVADSDNNIILLIQRSKGCVQDLDLPVTAEYKVNVVCTLMSHEVGFMSVNGADNIECWCLIVRCFRQTDEFHIGLQYADITVCSWYLLVRQ